MHYGERSETGTLMHGHFVPIQLARSNIFIFCHRYMLFCSIKWFSSLNSLLYMIDSYLAVCDLCCSKTCVNILWIMICHFCDSWCFQFLNVSSSLFSCHCNAWVIIKWQRSLQVCCDRVHHQQTASYLHAKQQSFTEVVSLSRCCYLFWRNEAVLMIKLKPSLTTFEKLLAYVMIVTRAVHLKASLKKISWTSKSLMQLKLSEQSKKINKILTAVSSKLTLTGHIQKT